MSATDLTLTQAVHAPPTQVYDAWVDPDQLATWWWPQLEDATYELDPRAGGGYRITSERAGIGVHGEFVALDADKRLELTWVWEDGAGDARADGPEERVVVTFEAEGPGTLVTVAHACADAEAVAPYRQGWTDVLTRLGAIEVLD